MEMGSRSSRCHQTRLRKTCNTPFFSHQPSSGDEDGEFSQLNAKFALRYEVAKAPSNILKEYENILSTAMKRAKQNTVSIFEDVNTYDVEVQGPVEEYFDAVFEDEFLGKPASRTFGDLDLDSLHGVIIVNPNKFRSDVFSREAMVKNINPFDTGILTVASDTHKVGLGGRSMSSSISVQALAHMALYVLMKAQWHHHLFLDLVISNTSSWKMTMSLRGCRSMKSFLL